MIDCFKIFPTKLSFGIFLAYMSLFVNQGILVKSSANEDNQFQYNPALVVLITEFLKLIVSLLFCTQKFTFDQFCHEVRVNKGMFFKYIIPSMLYCIYNNLMFINLQSYDPTTYFMLLQFRVVFTGVIYQFLFKRYLTYPQWLSLFLLTAGCILKQVNFTNVNSVSPSYGSFSDYINHSFMLIILQVFSSCFAGVYNEYLIKKTDQNNNLSVLDIWIHNSFFCAQSIICSIFYSILSGAEFSFKPTQAETDQLNFFSLLNFKIFLIILNNAAAGLVTSIFLKTLNSVLKTFASALEIVFTGVFSWLILSVEINLVTLVSIFLILLATYIYANNPLNSEITEKENSTNNKKYYDKTIV